MTRQLLKDTFGWGMILWLIGYILGIVLYPFVAIEFLGWIIMPIGTGITLWVLLKKIQLKSFQQYTMIAIVWLLIAVICDYFLLVKLFNPKDGYYKGDVYVYYILTFTLPLLVWWKKAAIKK